MWRVDRRLRVGAAGVMLALVVTACGQSSTHMAGEGETGMGHVHGLGVDPADRAVYVAGHYGLFKIKSVVSAERVADRVQDYMGFTVIGPRTFLASGHPSEAAVSAGGSPHLGLIRTTDSGVTWTTVSEGGTADFHALQPAGDLLYAYDSQTGKVRRSADQGQTWQQGTDENVIDLAATSTQPHRLYATTSDGVLVSDNAGLEFTPVKNAPMLSHLDSPAEDTLVGAGADGQIHMSRDAGKTWTSTGRLPGQATAFTAVDQQRLLASMEDGSILQSTNGGKDFTLIFRPAAT